MNVSVERDKDQILAIYISLKEGEVARTVEIVEGAVYADEDEAGNLLGVEMLAPGELQIHVRSVTQRYTHPSVSEALSQALDTVRVA